MPSSCVPLCICFNSNQTEGTRFVGCYTMLLSKQFLMFLKSNHAFIVQRQALQEHSVTSEKT